MHLFYLLTQNTFPKQVSYPIHLCMQRLLLIPIFLYPVVSRPLLVATATVAQASLVRRTSGNFGNAAASVTQISLSSFVASFLRINKLNYAHF